MPELRKEITVTRGITLAVTMVIGSGILGLPGLALELGSPHEVLAGWVLISLGMEAPEVVGRGTEESVPQVSTHVEIERNLYKTLYEQLLDRVTARG